MQNYDKEMQKVIASLTVKPKLLLHACCAPCSTAAIDKLKDFFDITVYFFNPNMDTLTEYELRAEELKRYCDALNISVVKENYEPTEFYERVKGFESAPEGGKRCEICFKLRLTATAKYAKENAVEISCQNEVLPFQEKV